MPQSAPNFVIQPANETGLQEQINLQATGNYVLVGTPGGPAVFANYGGLVIPQIAGSRPISTIVRGK